MRTLPPLRARTLSPRRRPIALLVLGAAVWAALSATAGAEDAPTTPQAKPPSQARKGRMELTARLEPADLGPGRSGKLVVTGKTGDLHVYADDSSAMKWRAIPVEGVTYATPETPVTYDKLPKGVTLSAPHPYQDESGDDPYPVWEGTFEMTVDVTVGEKVAPGTEIGLLFDYSGCDKETCYERQKNHRAVAALPGGAPGGVPAPAADAKPRVTDPCSDDAAEVRLEVKETGDGRGEATVTFAPREGYHLSLPGGSGPGLPIEVKPRAEDGVTWGAVPSLGEGGEFTDARAYRIPYRRTGARVAITVSWQGCSDEAHGGKCIDPAGCTLVASFGPEAAGPAPVADELPAEPLVVDPSAVVFPVVPGEPMDADTQSDIERQWKERGFLTLLALFGIGLLLAFTPCVFPLIPITISVISGGRADLPRARLTALLLTYVAGLSVAFGTLGLVASLGGSSMSAAFETPAATWAIAGIFALLAFGMMGVYEMQPPQWLMKVQGGAQGRGGSIVGAFLLGAVAAVLASPCTAPVVAGLLVFTAKEGNAVLGFIMFATLGLGMGAVLFAAGALNFAMRPGPWMVWIRYAFGVLLVAAALYYVANSELLSPVGVFVGGFALAAITWFLIAWHLMRKEGAQRPEAQKRGFQVALLLVVATAGVAFLTKPPPSLDWTKVADVEHLKREVASAKAAGQPVVVDIWATWCKYCKKYEEVIADDPGLRAAFGKLRRLKIDVTDGPRNDLRSALGMKAGQPQMVFLDGRGRILQATHLDGWKGNEDKSKSALQKRVELLLGKDEPTAAAASPR
jgi:thiol:disulfide interchange protein DsbD